MTDRERESVRESTRENMREGEREGEREREREREEFMHSSCQKKKKSAERKKRWLCIYINTPIYVCVCDIYACIYIYICIMQ